MENGIKVKVKTSRIKHIGKTSGKRTKIDSSQETEDYGR